MTDREMLEKLEETLRYELTSAENAEAWEMVNDHLKATPQPLSALDRIAFEFAIEMEMEQSESGRHVDLDSLMGRWARGGLRVTIESLDYNPDLEVDVDDLTAAWEDPKVQRVLTNATESYERSVREGRRI